jgi:hypothetical protein
MQKRARRGGEKPHFGAKQGQKRELVPASARQVAPGPEGGEQVVRQLRVRGRTSGAPVRRGGTLRGSPVPGGRPARRACPPRRTGPRGQTPAAGCRTAAAVRPRSGSARCAGCRGPARRAGPRPPPGPRGRRTPPARAPPAPSTRRRRPRRRCRSSAPSRPARTTARRFPSPRHRSGRTVPNLAAASPRSATERNPRSGTPAGEPSNAAVPGLHPCRGSPRIPRIHPARQCPARPEASASSNFHRPGSSKEWGAHRFR